MFSSCPADILLLFLDYLPSKYYFGEYYNVLIDMDVRYKRLIPVYKDRLINKLGNVWTYNINWCLKEAAAINNYVEVFIEIGANKWNDGLEGALYNGDTDLINFFIEKGADNFEDALCAAVLSENIKTIEWVLSEHACILNREFTWRNVLFSAAKSKNSAILHILKKKYEEIYGLYDYDNENLNIYYGVICTGTKELIESAYSDILEYADSISSLFPVHMKP